MNEKETWTLVEQEKEIKLIKNKWVFCLKLDGNGNIERYKARLVAKGYSQVQDIDYHETFSPVSTMPSTRIIFQLSMIEHMKIKQLDIKTAFLNGIITEDLYMNQPEGFDDGTGRVCKLNRSIYGLKQASHVWYNEIDKFFKEIGFINCLTDQCIYRSNDEQPTI